MRRRLHWLKAPLPCLVEQLMHHGMIFQGCRPLDLLEEDLVLGIPIHVSVRGEVAMLRAITKLPVGERRMNLVA